MLLRPAAGERLDRVVAAALPALSRRQIRALFDGGRVLVVDGRRRRRARRGELSSGAPVEIDVDHPSDAAVPAPLPLTILLETASWVVVDKEAGVPSAPVDPGEVGTVANALVARYPEMGEVGFRPREPGLCHRLDTQTSGLLLAARSAQAFGQARAAIREGRLDKHYLLVCRDSAAVSAAGRIDLALRSRGDRVVVDPNGSPALTEYRVERRGEGRLLVRARIGAGFRHQIRVHFAALGAPLAGDQRYGGEVVPGLERHALHASRLILREEGGFDVSSPLPPALSRLLEPAR